MTARSRAPGGLAAGRSHEGGAARRLLLADAVVHGGRLGAAMAAYPDAPKPWLDLSTGINPDPWKGSRASFDALCRLPDPHLLAQLEATAAAAFGAADPACVVATAGAESGLRLLSRVLQGNGVDIVSPTYAGHEAAWRTAGAEVRSIDADVFPGSAADVLVLVNPNNPDGRTVPREDLAAVVASRTRANRWTIVDESFVETQPELSVADLTSARLIVLRSFGKFYGLAGLRLGFVIAPLDVAAQIREVQGEWPVSGEAVAMGIDAYGDPAWRERTRAELARRAEDLDALLNDHGFQIVGGTSLFRLARRADAASVFDHLCRAGVLTRPFASRPGWLRFGLPRQQDFSRLRHALQGLTS